MSTKVFVGNLNFKTLSEKLTEEFGTAGTVVNANIITRGPRSLGYGFVEFATTEDAEKAVEQLNQREIDGRPINVELAKPRQEPAEGGDAVSEREPVEKPRRRRNNSNTNNNNNDNTTTNVDYNDANNFNDAGNRRPRRRRNFNQQGQGQGQQGQQGQQLQGQHQGYQGQHQGSHQGQHQGQHQQGQQPRSYRRVQQYRPRDQQHDGDYQADYSDQGQEEGYSNTGYNNTGYNNTGGRGGYNNYNNNNNTGGYNNTGYRRDYPRQRFNKPRPQQQQQQQQQQSAPAKPFQPRTKPAAPTQRPRQRERVASKAALFVANLPFSVEDAELQQIFSEKMAIRSAHVVKKRNGRSKGFGFVEFNNEEDQLAALQAFEGLKVHDRTINVKVALVADESHPEGEEAAEGHPVEHGDGGEKGAHVESGEKPVAETSTEAKSEVQPEKAQ